ncbi:MAG: HNH endonuclease [Bdellovibrionales bacterium]|nr:HNH endonuclease [Bdellovibrionales bacterium]
MGRGALILNSGYEPVKVVSWQKAILLWLQDKCEVLEFHSFYVRSASDKFQLPSVLRLRRYISPYISVKVRLSRQNLFMRDGSTCQYCGQKYPEKRLTIDHVTPLCRGGRHEWTNVVTACSPCNNRKGGRSPLEAGMPLLSRPHSPRWLPSKDFRLEAKQWPSSWQPYLHRLMAFG